MVDSRVEKAVQFMIDVANNPDHGYDQMYRWGEKGDFDCSSLTITAFERAGFPVKTKYSATYTGNMKQAFLKCGFEDVKSKVNIYTGQGLQRGDILLNEVHHVAVYIGGGKIVQASINEKGTATGGRPGDQTGYEINISPYRNYKRGWDCVLRLPNKSPEKPNITKTKGDDEVVKIIKIKSNGKTPTVSAINKDGHYYVKLRDLETLGLLKVGYDKEAKMPIVDSVK